VFLLIISGRIHVALALNHLFVKEKVRVPSSDVGIMMGKVFPVDFGFSA